VAAKLTRGITLSSYVEWRTNIFLIPFLFFKTTARSPSESDHIPKMYRTAALARRLLSGATAGNNSNSRIRYLNLRTTIIGSRYCTAVNNNHSFPQSIFNQNQTPRANLEFPNQSESTSSSNWSTSSTAEDGRQRQERQKPRIEYQEQQARVLEASLHHVVRILKIN
jgi:ubiquinone biosynthesis protein COQ9